MMVIIFLIATSLPDSVHAQDGNIEKREYVCMMQDSVLASPGIPIKYEGRTYYGCCPMCNENIKGNPDRYTKARDPVTGVTVDKASALIYAYKGKIYYFETEPSRSEFARRPLAYVSGSSQRVAPMVASWRISAACKIASAFTNP